MELSWICGSDDDRFWTNRTSLGLSEWLVAEQQGAAEDSLRILMSYYFWSGGVLAGCRVNFWQGCWETKWPLRSELLRRQMSPVVSPEGKTNLGSVFTGRLTHMLFEPSGFSLRLWLYFNLCYILVLKDPWLVLTYDKHVF